MDITIKPSIHTALLLFAVLFTSLAAAESPTRYVTDQLEVTLRSGSSTSNSIIAMLKSGDSVKVLEEDVATKYSLVETESGKTGYVLTRFLDIEPSGRARFASLQTVTEKLRATIKNLEKERDEYKNRQINDTKTINTLKSSLTQTENELNELKAATHDTIQVIQQNDSLKSRINELETNMLQLSEENARYKDSTAMDWFIRGASVALIAFLLGIIVTRIRWKKRDSWGSY